MKKLLLTISVLSALQGLNAQTLDRSVRPKPGPAPIVNIADAKTFTLPNGLKVYVVENHKLPQVSYSIQLDLSLPHFKEKAGITDVFGEMLTAGTKTRSKEKFLNDKENIGATIAASHASLYGASLTKHQEKLLELMSDCLLNPNFSNEELEKLTKQLESSLIMASTNAEAIISNVSRVVNYGANHPYAEITTEETIKNVNLQDIQNYYTTYFRPNVAYLAIVGDITLDEAKKLVTKYFSKWEKADVPVEKMPEVAKPKGVQVHFSPKAGAVQSEIEIAAPIDFKHDAKDLNAAKVMNHILGGGGSARLFTNLRENKAWTYGSYSSIQQDKNVGLVKADAKCRNEVTDSAVAEMLKEIATIRNNNVSQEELQGSINYLNGVFALGLRSPSTIAAYAINIDKYNLPKDYYKTYMQRTSAVTVNDVRNAANKYFDPNNINVIVVGSNEEANKLKRFSTTGEVLYYDKNGNPTKAAVEKSVAGVDVNTVMNKYVNAIGGEAVIKSIKSLSAEGSTVFQGMPVEIKEVIESPNKVHTSQKISVQGQTIEILQVMNGDKGFMSQMGQRMDLQADDLADMKEKADFAAILNDAKTGFKNYKLVNETELDGTPVYYVQKTDAKGKATQMYFDVNTGLLVRKIRTIEAQGQTMTVISDFKDYKEVPGAKGYKKPFTVVSDNGPQGVMTIKFKSIKANDKVDQSLFKI